MCDTVLDLTNLPFFLIGQMLKIKSYRPTDIDLHVRYNDLAMGLSIMKNESD